MRKVGTPWRFPHQGVFLPVFCTTPRTNLLLTVANLWANRLIGDAQPGTSKVAFAAMPTYRTNAPLRRAGLIGPVQLLLETR